MSPEPLSGECQACTEQHCVATFSRDGAIWFLPGHRFRPGCPILKLVQAVGARQLEREAKRHG